MKFLKMYANCIFVNGNQRSIIYDISRENWCFVPNSLFRISRKFDLMPFNAIQEEISDEKENKIFLEYVNFLIENNFSFFTNLPKQFPQLNISFQIPNEITNAIIDFKSDSFNYINCKIIEQLDELFCMSLQLRFYENISYSILDKQLKPTANSRLRDIQLVMPYNKALNLKKLKELHKNHCRISQIIIFNSPNKINYINKEKTIPVFYIKEEININSCGVTHSSNFIINNKIFTESQLHNTCLNRKICIDADGEIKNCPSMSRSFGNIKDTTLKEAIEKPGFKDLWFICKDKIDVCKDCEFRHMCTDCRAFKKDPENIYSQPSKCHYNPYIAKWKGEEGYVPVEECGTYNKETGFVVDKKKVKKLNKEIWGED